MLADRSYSNFADFLITLTLIEGQIVFISGVQHDTLGMLVFGTPVMHRLQQLLTVVLALKLRMNPQQWQYMYGIARQTGHQCGLIIEVTPGAAKTGAQDHAHAPCPAFRDAQAPLWWRNQGNADQPVVDQQAERRQFLEKMLLDQLSHCGTNALVVARALRLEQKGKGRLMSIGVIQQRTRLAAVATIKQADLSRGSSRFGHADKPPKVGIHCL